MALPGPVLLTKTAVANQTRRRPIINEGDQSKTTATNTKGRRPIRKDGDQSETTVTNPNGPASGRTGRQTRKGRARDTQRKIIETEERTKEAAPEKDA